MAKKKQTFHWTRLLASSLNGLVKIAPELTGKIAFTLFCTPLRKRKKPSETAFLQTGIWSTKKINGRTYALYEWGQEGPLALFFHGWESHSGRWRKLIPLYLNAGYRVIAADGPAHGRSSGSRFTMIEYARMMEHLIREYRPERVIGHSVGASSLLWAMGNLESTFLPKKAILLCPFSQLSYTLNKTANSLGIAPAVMEAMQHRLQAFAALRLEDIDLAQKASTLTKVQGLLIHDKDDKVTAHTESERIHAAWPTSQLLLTEGNGHGLTAPKTLLLMVND
jgi:pimeloyl-ACP methyl ester carboxylesterase